MDDREVFFGQYKLYVQTAENVSEKRQTANTYFLSLNSFLLVLSGYLTTTDFKLWNAIMVIAGIVICFLWIFNLQSYRSLNTSKYKVICNMEKKLPVKLFDDEWKFLGRGEEVKRYLKLSVVEQGVPIIFIFLYWLIFFLNLIYSSLLS